MAEHQFGIVGDSVFADMSWKKGGSRVILECLVTETLRDVCPLANSTAFLKIIVCCALCILIQWHSRPLGLSANGASTLHIPEHCQSVQLSPP